MSVVTPVRSRFFLAIGSSIVMVAGMLFGANVAAADSVQVQSYQRASQTATCDSPPESMTEWRASWANPSDPISGPTWHPSWERWANNGNGGWTCTRSITWARAPVSSGSTANSYALGDTGPGGGLVFLISGGKTYEMALNTWSGAATPDAVASWCNVSTNVITSDGIGTGAANTVAMDAACTSGAGQSAADYSANGLSDWFLPSKDELNAMCNYSRNPVSPEAPTDACNGTQDPTFAGGLYGFAGAIYWSSSQYYPTNAWYQSLDYGSQSDGRKTISLRVRPIRAF